MSARPELRALTGMRGIAAWWVVFFHIRGSIAGLPDAAERIAAHGYLAVDFFFLLSGFVIWLSWGPRLRNEGLAATPRFLVKRIARIWPLHLAMLGVAIALAALLALTGRDDPAFPWEQLPLHLLLVQNWGFTDRLAWNDPAWSISAELAAYLLFPLLIRLVDWRRIPSAALVVLAACVLAGLHAIMREQASLGADIPRYGVARCLCEFAVGGIVCVLWQRWRDVAGAGWTAAAVGALALAAWLTGAAETLAVPIGFAALLLALAIGAGAPRHPLEGRIVHYLGEVSYATYLSHFLLWKLFKLAFVGADGMASGFGIAAYLLAVLAASILLYHGLERPAQRRVERLAATRRSPRLAPQA